MKLTEHFSYEELIKSDVALRRGFRNTPSTGQLACLKNLAVNVLEPLRVAYGKPIIITSGYRTKALNKVVGGASSSQHTLGMAADFTTFEDTTEENKILFDIAVSSGLPFDQLINEYGFNWIHISFNALCNRGQVLTCSYSNGRASYTNVTKTYTVNGKTAYDYINSKQA